MKRAVCLGIIFILAIFLLAGCHSKPGLSLLKIEEGSAPDAVRNFIQEQSDQNGVDLYSDGVHGDFLFLNAHNIENGGKASYFEDVTCKIIDGNLCIYFCEKQTENASQTANSALIYKIDSEIEYHTIRVFRNGQEIRFDVVGA